MVKIIAVLEVLQVYLLTNYMPLVIVLVIGLSDKCYCGIVCYFFSIFAVIIWILAISIYLLLLWPVFQRLLLFVVIIVIVSGML